MPGVDGTPGPRGEKGDQGRSGRPVSVLSLCGEKGRKRGGGREEGWKEEIY